MKKLDKVKSPKKKDKRLKDKKKIKKNPEDDALKIIEKEEAGIEIDPRRQKFAAFYLDPASTTYGNALKSAIRAGFSPEYAKIITTRGLEWLSDIVRRMGILEKAKSNLAEHLNLNPVVQAMGPFGPIFSGKGKDKKPVMVESNVRLKLRQDITMFTLEKLDNNFKKKEKGDMDPLKVEIKQIIILAPDGQRYPYNQTGTQAVPSLPSSAQ